jgi:uncharacterized protein (DUF3084 family)
MVALGGFISYFGDIQGSRWGKKRVTWLGMRPKRTAQVITALTGAGISALSIITLLLVSPTIRKMVVHGEQIITENRTLLQRLTKLRTQYEDEIRQSEADSRKLALKQTALQLRNHDLEQKRADLTQRAADLTQRVLDKVARIDTLAKREIALTSQKTMLEARLASDRKQIHKVTDWSKELSDRNLALTRNSDELQNTVNALTSTRAQLASDTEQLRKERDTLKAINVAMTNDNNARAQANEEMQARNNELEAYNSTLKANQKELEDRNNYLLTDLVDTTQKSRQESINIRRGRVNFRRGEMLARRVIDGHLRPERVRAELNSLMDDASVMATIRGAGRGENGRAVRIVTKRTIFLTGVEDAEENDTLNSLVDSLSGHDTPVVVMANVVNNSVVGEQVVIDITSAPISQAFKRGDVVASVEVDGTQRMEGVLDSIVKFLEHDVHDAAVKAGLVPRIDPESGEESIGNMGPQDLIPLTDRIRRMGGQVRVTAVARKAMTSTDPLSLDFKVTRVPVAP